VQVMGVGATGAPGEERERSQEEGMETNCTPEDDGPKMGVGAICRWGLEARVEFGGNGEGAESQGREGGDQRGQKATRTI